MIIIIQVVEVGQTCMALWNRDLRHYPARVIGFTNNGKYFPHLNTVYRIGHSRHTSCLDPTIFCSR